MFARMVRRSARSVRQQVTSVASSAFRSAKVRLTTGSSTSGQTRSTGCSSDRLVALSTHRWNYGSFAGDAARNLALLDTMLGAIRLKQPDTTYLTSDEVRQLWQTGASSRIHGTMVILRNWTENTTLPLLVQFPERVGVRILEPVCRFAAGNVRVSDDENQVFLMPVDYRGTLDPVVS